MVMVVGLLCELATGGELIRNGPTMIVAWWYQPLQALVVSAYFVASWLRGGQTLGMRAWHIRMSDIDGSPVTLRRSLLRLLAAAAPLLLLFTAPWLGPIGALWAVLGAWAIWFAVALLNPRRRALHDIIAGTEMCRIG